MSFYSHFRKKCICEWREYYVSYKLFKQLFKPFKKTSKIYGQLVDSKIKLTNQMYSIDSADVGEEIDQLKLFEERFLTLIHIESEKIDSFFQLKFMEFQNDWIHIQENAEVFKPFRFEKSHTEKGRQLKNAFYLFYMKVNYLIQYVNLNYDALSRLLRKHRKLTKNYSKMMQVSDLKIDTLFKTRYISQNSDSLIQLRDDVTSTFLDVFYHRYNKDHGVKELKSLLKTRIISVWHSYFLFFFLGCTISLLIFILVMAIYGNIDPDDDETFRYIFPMFRGSAFIVLYLWFLGWNVYIWTRYHINYKKIFQFNYHFSTPTEILMRGTFFASILLIIFIWYIVINEDMGKLADGLRSLKIPKEFLPLILWILLISYLFFPSKKWFNGEGRKYFFTRLYRLFFFSPFVMIDYPTAWVTDQMLSFVIPMQDFAYTICYYISRIINYDDMHPQQCFTNTVVVGFLVAFLPVMYRIIHFLYYLYYGYMAVRNKQFEIQKMQNEENLKTLEHQVASSSVVDIAKNKNNNNVGPSVEKTEPNQVLPNTANSNNNETLQIKSIVSLEDKNIINNEPKSEIDMEAKEHKDAVDVVVMASEPKDNQDNSFVYIEKNMNKSPLLRKEDNKSQLSELMTQKLKELDLLKQPFHTNILFFICLILVMFVTIFSYLFAKYPDSNLFLGFWVATAFLLSSYAYYLDVTKDWALFQPNKKHLFLRERLGYQKKTFYYFAIILDLFLRWVWVFAISPGTSSKLMRPELFTFLMGGFEMFRRAIWNFMIIEKIFITNLEDYKCLYEYELPFSKEEVENRKEQIKKGDDLGDYSIQRKKKSVFQSSDCEDEFKFRFWKKKKSINNNHDLKKGLLEDADVEIEESKCENEIERKKVHEEKKTIAESPNQNIISEKLHESIIKSKAILESFISLEKDVKSFKENLHKRYDNDPRRKHDKKEKSTFEVILNCFQQKK